MVILHVAVNLLGFKLVMAQYDVYAMAQYDVYARRQIVIYKILVLVFKVNFVI